MTEKQRSIKTSKTSYFGQLWNALLYRPTQYYVEEVETKPRIEVVPRDVCRIGISEWRSDPAMVEMARKALNRQEFRLMLDCLNNDHPGKAMLGLGVPAEQCALQQKLAEGYALALKALEALGELKPKYEYVPSTYGAEVPKDVDADA